MEIRRTFLKQFETIKAIFTTKDGYYRFMFLLIVAWLFFHTWCLAQNNRYEMTHIPGGISETFIYDKRTGRAWDYNTGDFHQIVYRGGLGDDYTLPSSK